jgi:hypothetical protein
MEDKKSKVHKMDDVARENTQGLIDKHLLLDGPTLEEVQLKTKQAMHKFVIKRTG